MADLPYFPCYAADWQNDQKLKGLDLRVKGFWFHLCLAMWLSPEPGKLVVPPGKEEDRFIADCLEIDVRSARHLLEIVETSAISRRDTEGVLYSKRLVEEAEKLEARSHKLSEAGRLGARRRWKEGQSADGQANGQANGHPNGNQTQIQSQSVHSSTPESRTVRAHTRTRGAEGGRLRPTAPPPPDPLAGAFLDDDLKSAVSCAWEYYWKTPVAWTHGLRRLLAERAAEFDSTEEAINGITRAIETHAKRAQKRTVKDDFYQRRPLTWLLSEKVFSHVANQPNEEIEWV